MQKQITKIRDGTPHWLDWLVEPFVLLIGCAVLVGVTAFAIRWNDGERSRPLPSQRDDARCEIENLPWQPVQGQRLYVPAYSHSFDRHGKRCSWTPVLSIRNTDPGNEIVVTSVRYFGVRGEELDSLLRRPLKLNPLAATEFTVDERTVADGASFIVEWRAGTEVTPPLVESLNINLSSPCGLSFTAPAIVLEETGADPSLMQPSDTSKASNAPYETVQASAQNAWQCSRLLCPFPNLEVERTPTT